MGLYFTSVLINYLLANAFSYYAVINHAGLQLWLKVCEEKCELIFSNGKLDLRTEGTDTLCLTSLVSHVNVCLYFPSWI